MSFSKILVIDWETSGLLRDLDSSRAYSSGPQGIEIGAVVVDTESWTSIGEFTSRVRFDSEMLWEDQAESIHGLSRRSLNDSPSTEIVAERLDEFLGGFFDRREPILLAGQNPGFDRWFTCQLFYRAAVYRTANPPDAFPWRFHSRMIDTFTLGFFCWGCSTGDELYRKVCGVIRRRHSAHEDARLTAEVLCKAFRVNTNAIEDDHDQPTSD